VTQPEIKTRYRALVKECHPDLVTANGNDQEIKQAALRFCELQEAYEALCESLTT
jgi:curved DNA-binding protein CbpA